MTLEFQGQTRAIHISSILSDFFHAIALHDLEADEAPRAFSKGAIVCLTIDLAVKTLKKEHITESHATLGKFMPVYFSEGWDPRPSEEELIDMGLSLLEPDPPLNWWEQSKIDPKLLRAYDELAAAMPV